MIYSNILIVLLAIATTAYLLGRSRSISLAEKKGGVASMHSLPSHYGSYTALFCCLPSLVILTAYALTESHWLISLVTRELPQEILALSANEFSLIINDIKNSVAGDITVHSANPVIIEAATRYASFQETLRNALGIAATVLAVGLMLFFLRSIHPQLQARNIVERVIKILLILCAAIAILTTIGIVMSVLFEAIRFFKVIPITDFLTGLDWSPQTPIREDQAGSSGAFGAVPVFAGTMLIAAIAMGVAIPIGLMSAIYLSEYASKRFRAVAKPLLEILAGIPTVVYGFFAALVVAPAIRDLGDFFNLAISSESALAAGLVMGIMIIPFVSSLSDDVIHAVPQAMRDGSYGLGATQYETIRHVVIPAALPGIVGGVLLAVSRAIGETMIVVMAAGLSANLTANPFKAVTTVTVQIVTLLVGDQEFDSPKTLAAFALGLLLFFFTLVLNFIALRVVRRYREQYE